MAAEKSGGRLAVSARSELVARSLAFVRGCGWRDAIAAGQPRRAGRDRLRVFQPASRVEHHDLVALGQPAGLAQLPGGGEAGRSLRTDPGTLQARGLPLAG